MSLLIKSPPLTSGYTAIAALKYLTFGRLYLTPEARTYQAKTDGTEVALDVFSGRCTVKVQDRVFEAGGRADAFEGPPSAVYLPPGSEYEVECIGGATMLGVFSAPASGVSQPAALVTPAEVMTQQVGRDNWSRTVYTAVGENLAAAKLLLGETVNPPGHWSSSPPHKHDRYAPPSEVPMEEIYYFQLKPPQGFGFMRVYTDPDAEHPFDEAYVVEDGDTVVIPRGYHPVVAGPGYRLHYAWCLAGEERRYGAWSDDPRHSWIKSANS
jgi:5-deoxy-glucuronate isomerase